MCISMLINRGTVNKIGFAINPDSQVTALSGQVKLALATGGINGFYFFSGVGLCSLNSGILSIGRTSKKNNERDSDQYSHKIDSGSK